jgi:hypothetical protein
MGHVCVATCDATVLDFTRVKISSIRYARLGSWRIIGRDKDTVLPLICIKPTSLKRSTIAHESRSRNLHVL